LRHRDLCWDGLQKIWNSSPSKQIKIWYFFQFIKMNNIWKLQQKKIV